MIYLLYDGVRIVKWNICYICLKFCFLKEMLLKIGKDGYNNNILFIYIYILYINVIGKDKKEEKI